MNYSIGGSSILWAGLRSLITSIAYFANAETNRPIGHDVATNSAVGFGLIRPRPLRRLSDICVYQSVSLCT